MKMDAKRVITFSGGFHERRPIKVIARIDRYGYPVFSRRQEAKLNRHFCTQSDCLCGGFLGARHEYKGQWQ